MTTDSFDFESDGDGELEERPDGGEHTETYTIRLELVDEPGQLLRALEPIADRGGNLLSIFHERGNVTPRGHIPVEVDLSCPPERFEDIVAALREQGINVIQAGSERYDEEVTLLLIGHLIETDLSDTLERIERHEAASIADLSLSTPREGDDPSSARLRIAVESDGVRAAIETVRSVTEQKDIDVIEPLTEGKP